MLLLRLMVGGGGAQGKREAYQGQNRAASEHPKASALRIRLLTNMFRRAR